MPADHERFIQIAIDEAAKGGAEGNSAVGSIIVEGNTVIGVGRNTAITTHDPTAGPARQIMAMATRIGAKALYLDHLTGSLEAGKRADLVLVDLNTLHSRPHFDHDPDAIYSRLVYATKSTDVTDVMVEGRWLLRDRQLQTIEPEPSLQAAAEYAKRIDAFLIEREGYEWTKMSCTEFWFQIPAI